jgi:signal peptidase I
MRAKATSAARPESSPERCALAADALRRSGRLRLRVFGESMLPALWPGDVVEVASCSLAELRPGEVALAFRGGRFFLHRFVGSEFVGSDFAGSDFAGSDNENRFLLLGDSMPRPDLPYEREALLGRVVGRLEAGNSHALSIDAWGRLSAWVLRPGIGAKLCRAIGFLLCHCSLLRRLALKLHSRRLEFGGRESARDLAEMGA